MKQQMYLRKTAFALYAVTAVLLLVFSVYMLCFEKTSVYSSREYLQSKVIKNYTVTDVSAPETPLGTKRVYRFTPDVISGDSSLMFYVVHNYADVRIDGMLLYSSYPGKNNRLGNSPSSYWVVIPVTELDRDKTVTITLTPVYKSAVNKVPDFIIGSRYSLFMRQLRSDLPQMVFSTLCIAVGILLIAVQLHLILRRRTSAWNMFFLGNSSLLLGIWRITDTRLSAFVFKDHTMAIGYITLAALFIMSAPILLYADKQSSEDSFPALNIGAVATCLVALVSLALQVFSAIDLRQCLTACHAMLIIDIVLLLSSAFFYNRHGKRDVNSVIFALLLISGGITDIVVFYVKGTSSGITITLAAFLIYAVYEFIENILSINKKARIDLKTKLFNKAYWEDLIKTDSAEDGEIGMIMFDLNSLKRTNDTLGHNAGDKMILEFSSILKREIGKKELLCRWGGDEFAVYVRDADRRKITEYISAVTDAVKAYNRSGKSVKIHFACGYALSCDFPELSRRDLLAKADEYMYIDKKRWHEKH